MPSRNYRADVLKDIGIGTDASFAGAASGRGVLVNAIDTATVVDTFPKATYRTAFYWIQIIHGTDFHSLCATVVHTGTDAHITIYGEVWTNTVLGEITADVNGANVELTLDPVSTSTSIRIMRTCMTA